MILELMSGSDGGERHLLGRSGGCQGLAAAGEDDEADVAAHLGLLVVLLGQDGAAEPDQGIAGREDADDDARILDLAHSS